jgi:hypothetical protein
MRLPVYRQIYQHSHLVHLSILSSPLRQVPFFCANACCLPLPVTSLCYRRGSTALPASVGAIIRHRWAKVANIPSLCGECFLGSNAGYIFSRNFLLKLLTVISPSSSSPMGKPLHSRPVTSPDDGSLPLCQYGLMPVLTSSIYNTTVTFYIHITIIDLTSYTTPNFIYTPPRQSRQQHHCSPSLAV